MTGLLPMLVPLFVLIGLLLAGMALSSMLRRARRSRSDGPGKRLAAPPVMAPSVPAVIASTKLAGAHAAAELPYTRQRFLLTQAEREFFTVLCAAAPEGWHVFPQVRLANLVALQPGLRNWKPHFSRVAQKCVDFVLCDGAELAPQLVVELDDSSHDRADRQARDRFVDAALRSAGLPILHVRWQRQYDAALLAGQIRTAIGVQAVVRSALPGSRERSVGAAAGAARSDLWACRKCSMVVGATEQFCNSCGARLTL